MAGVSVGDDLPALSAGIVHVWRVDLDREGGAGIALLAPDEAERAGRFRFARDRRRFVAGRVALRRLLGRYLGRAPGDVRFGYGVNGKPHLLGDGGEGELTFNVANSDGWALIACTRGRAVGVDLEAIKEVGDLAGLAAYCMAPAELAAWQGLVGKERVAVFYRLWARKESYLKARGDGLGAPLTRICVTLEPFPVPRVLKAEGLPGETGQYASVDLGAVSGYAGALTVAGAGEWEYVVRSWA
jgi:4'-phosphopantetheinyl transferase